MILLFTYEDEEDGVIRVSHGINMHTGKTVIMSDDPLSSFYRDIKAGKATTNEYDNYKPAWWEIEHN